MTDTMNLARHIFGLHDPGGEWLMQEKGKSGWIVFTHGLGHDPNDQGGFDYRQWSDRGFTPIARLNHGYGSEGTLPLPQFYNAFAIRVRNFCGHSQGCSVWIIGNEMNHGQERPQGQIITPERYADCYKMCWDQIHNLPNREYDQVVVGAVAPWNNTTAYPGNDTGDWVRYYLDILEAIRRLNCPIDAISLHTYTHGTDPALVFNEQKMNPPFQQYHYHFRAYQDFMNATPAELRHVPVYITESDEDEPWENANRGWVQNAFKEINTWNSTPGRQQIRCLALYRWPKFDKWYIEGKGGVYDDFRAAMENDYTWKKMQVPREINGHVVQGAFLDFYNQMGEKLVGQPISDQVVENGLPTQYFERLALQQSDGEIVLKAIGLEVLDLRQKTRQGQEDAQVLRQSLTKAQEESKALRQSLTQTQDQIKGMQGTVSELERKLYELHPGPDGDSGGPAEPVDQVTQIVRPQWANVIYTLPRHETKRYEQRAVSAINYLVINHSAAGAGVPVQDIARFHVRNMGWPGIGYHFYIDGQGALYQTNELSTLCYHVQQWDPVSVGICVAGTFTQTIPTPAQIQTTAHLVAWLLQTLNLPLDAVKGKKEFIDTQSPGLQWLSGRQWKKLLLAEVQKAQAERAISHVPLPLYHYVLFGQTATDWAREEWLGAQAYIGRFRVTHGFSVDDARLARYVTVVGGTAQVDQTAEAILLQAGSEVERIAGRDAAETTRLLTEMAQRGQRFFTFPE